MNSKKTGLIKAFLLLFVVTVVVGASSATTNMIIITDPTGQDPNGAAAGSMSYAANMFQSTFIYSTQNHFCVLSGGEGDSTLRLQATVAIINSLKKNETPSQAASLTSSYSGIRIMCGTPTGGAAVGGSFDAYVIIVSGNGTINITPYSTTSGGLAVLPAGTKGAIIHLRNSEGNPLYGTADTVRLQTAENIGKMIRDGYPATYILGQAFGEVANDSGEDHGGGGINLVSGITTGDMFTPAELNQTGYNMSEPYSKTTADGSWSVSYPEADNYQVSPDGKPLHIVYAYQALANTITTTATSVTVSVYGSDEPGISQTTDEVVTASVKKNGYNSTTIAKAINSAIDNGLIVGVNYVEPKDINVKESSRAVGVYFKALPNSRTAPAWNLPISSSLLNTIGNIQTAIGLMLVVLVLFRRILIKSFFRKK
jgi:hypothetical protein